MEIERSLGGLVKHYTAIVLSQLKTGTIPLVKVSKSALETQ